MGFNINGQGSVTLFKAESSYRIYKPNEKVNQFTVKSEAEALKKLAVAGIEKPEMLKEVLKGVDMTSVTTRQLKAIGSRLWEAGLIDEGAAACFNSGSRDFDIEGKQRNLDKRFNAVALFSQMVGEYQQMEEEFSVPPMKDIYTSTMSSLIVANRVLHSLIYFANSARDNSSIDEQV